MINAFGHEVDPNEAPISQQLQQAREAKKGIFDEAEMAALRKIVEDLRQ